MFDIDLPVFASIGELLHKSLISSSGIFDLSHLVQRERERERKKGGKMNMGSFKKQSACTI